jgi:LysR family glycine cleavage system transcriptional activator
MPLRLPPLPALRFFEAAGRLQSFKRAAAELNVTPSAVSHGIVALEQALGIELFLRGPRGLTLTPEGTDYLPYIAEALSLIATGTLRLPDKRANHVITVTCAPTLASRWLLQRLHRFSDKWPKISVSVDTSRRHVGFPADGFDFALRMSQTPVAGAAWSKLFGEILVPVCSTATRHALVGADGQPDLRRATLIHVTPASEDWQAWLDHMGLEGVVDATRGLRFDTIQLAFEAASAGLGVALGRRPLVDRDLAAGTLVAAGPEWPAHTAYWLVCSEGTDHRPALVAFKRWLLREAEIFADPTPLSHRPGGGVVQR